MHTYRSHVKLRSKNKVKSSLAPTKMYQDEGNAIMKKEYAKGYTLFAFDVTPDIS